MAAVKKKISKAKPRSAKKIDITLEQLLEAGSHFGHQSRRWNPKMKPFLYTVKDDVHVFDLAKTREYLLVALAEISKAASEGKIFLLVGTKKQAKAHLREVAQEVEMPFVDERWLGGTLTNFDQMRKSVNYMEELKENRDKGIFKTLTKRERLMKDREIQKLERKFGGLKTLTKLPDVLIIIDVHKEHGAASEAKLQNIPTIGVVDSNSDPDSVDFPIPMNDDATKSVELVLDLIKKAIKNA